MFVWKIADFRSEEAEPCMGIVDLGLDQLKFLGGTQTVNQFWQKSKGVQLKNLTIL